MKQYIADAFTDVSGQFKAFIDRCSAFSDVQRPLFHFLAADFRYISADYANQLFHDALDMSLHRT